MKTLSDSQLRLLKQLGILPLTVKPGFLTDKKTQSSTDNMLSQADTANASARLAPDDNQLLVQDVRYILQQTAIKTWHINPQLTASVVQANALYTPDIALLKQPQHKRQLWQLLSAQHDV